MFASVSQRSGLNIVQGQSLFSVERASLVLGSPKPTGPSRPGVEYLELSRIGRSGIAFL